jgi:hypothetical protein
MRLQTYFEYLKAANNTVFVNISDIDYSNNS